MESVVLTTRLFEFLVFFLVDSLTEKQLYGLSCKGYDPGHGAFNDLRFSPFKTSEVSSVCANMIFCNFVNEYVEKHRDANEDQEN